MTRKISPIALAFTLLLILGTTGFSYVRVGRLQAWLLVGCICLVVLFASSVGQRCLKSAFAQVGRLIILPWMAYVIVIIVRDAASGGLGKSFGDRIGLNLACIQVFFVCVAMASACKAENVARLIAIIVAGQGVICLMQSNGMALGWKISEVAGRSVVASQSAGAESVEIAMRAGEMGARPDSARCRGTDLQVHKFAAYQGVMTAFVLGYGVLAIGASRMRFFSNWAYLLLGGLGGLGVILTASRAPVYGLGGAYILLVIHCFRSRRGDVGGILLGLGLVVSAVGFTLKAADFWRLERLGSVDRYDSNDSVRMASMYNSLDIFLKNPVFGFGSDSMLNAELVTHNVPLRVLSDFGLVGFFFYAAVWIGIMRAFVSFARKRGSICSICAIASFGAIFVAMMDNMTHSSGLLQKDVSQAAIFGVLLGMCIGIDERKREAAVRVPRQSVLSGNPSNRRMLNA